MSALPADTYRDPLDQLLAKEAATCKGCIHRTVPQHGARAYCGHPDVKQLTADARCDYYEDADS